MMFEITEALRQKVVVALASLDAVLPLQAPIQHFEYQNPLHGFQPLPFEEAIAQGSSLKGLKGYLPQADFLRFYQAGRISDEDISEALADKTQLNATEIMLDLHDRHISRGDIFRIAMLFDLEPVSPNQFAWQIEELAALKLFQKDVPISVKQTVLTTVNEREFILSLWQAVLRQLDIEQSFLHPENMLDLSLDQAEALLAQHRASRKKVSLKKASMHEQMCDAAHKTFAHELANLGQHATLRTFLWSLCGVDILDKVRPEIIRICSSALDEGVASWKLPWRSDYGMYAAWRATVGSDINPFLQELPDWQSIIGQLPENAVDAIILQLSYFGLAEEQWAGYLRSIALEIPGWSGMINWRERHPDYAPVNDTKPKLADYLAIRLTLDRLWLNQICRDTWQIEATLTSLQTYFRKNASEFMVRSHLFRGDLPEYLVEQAEAMTLSVGTERFDRTDWQYLADIIWTWQINNLTNCRPVHTMYDSAWRLFRISQHLGLNAEQIIRISKEQLESILTLLDEFTTSQRDFIWLSAYEHHYREDLLRLLHTHCSLKPSLSLTRNPDAQIIFCLDSREEAIRSQLESANSAIETLGTAGFMGLELQKLRKNKACKKRDFLGKDQTDKRIGETAQGSSSTVVPRSNHVYSWLNFLAGMQYHSLRKNLITTPFMLAVIAPLTLFRLIGKVLWPKNQQRLSDKIKQALAPKPETTLVFTEQANAQDTFSYSEEDVTVLEQSVLVANFLRNCGLTQKFSPLMVLMGHQSFSNHNPYNAAFRCHYCHGDQQDVNARFLAQLANQVEVRALLVAQGILIPDETWFIAAEHNTGNGEFTWFDSESVPVVLHARLSQLQSEIVQACQRVEYEREIKEQPLAHGLTLEKILARFQQRAVDFSDVSADPGHVGLAALLIGSRSLSRGLSLDRRVSVCSYAAAQDEAGSLLQDILLTVLPVEAAINLEYYFSTVDLDGLSSRSQELHNVIGRIGVMAGANSDLCTGLSSQMTEKHEAMRLLVIIESTISKVDRIIQQQSLLKEYVEKAWVHFCVIDSEQNDFWLYHVEKGFIPWNVKTQRPAKVIKLADAEEALASELLSTPLINSLS